MNRPYQYCISRLDAFQSLGTEPEDPVLTRDHDPTKLLDKGKAFAEDVRKIFDTVNSNPSELFSRSKRLSLEAMVQTSQILDRLHTIHRYLYFQ